ncbi:GspE/PulE family protein [Chitinimonas koreensis]|uniref:GspE/PulE family protein n=1 Tax=Chitinimonas koreensis TaxID=356302 RepID=UPI0004122378|nr:GspE/PulE family protein [Chitinimonas koreensis]QNM96325.1 Flp pilus assembly complex ATPase component TadA [Chitinimonas koreensis]
MNPPRKTRWLGEQLTARGMITPDQLRIALIEQRRTGAQLGRELVRLGFVSGPDLRDALAEQLGQEAVDLTQLTPAPAALALLSRETARRFMLLPLTVDEDRRVLGVAMAQPDDLVAIDQVRSLLHHAYAIEPVLAAETDLVREIDQHYGFELSIDGILNELELGQGAANPPGQAGPAPAGQPVMRLIDALLADAAHRGASDLHFEPEAQFVRIRYRIDGVLRQIRSLHKSYWPAMVNRIKVMAALDIAETRAPQDGRISLTLSGRPLDFRVAVQPTVHGENLVLRLLDRQKGLCTLDTLGLPEHNQAQLQRLMARPEGLILLTGPTGSGKTTTLYSILQQLNSERVNIMTLEDPVEYQLPLVRQTAVGDKLDFAAGIRALLRQDPDVILVGEIRDRETAEMAFRAAMTGHQVYATLHSNSAAGAIPRLLDLGIPADILAGNLAGVVAQRLLRKLCPACCGASVASWDECRLLGVSTAPLLPRAVGCDQCDGQGYRGRIAVLEVLRIDGALGELVAQRASLRTLLRQAREQGFIALVEDALRCVREGQTSLDEVARVIDLTDLP